MNKLFILFLCSFVYGEVEITAVGDIALGVVGTPMNLDTILNPVKQYLTGDFVFGNLEGVFSDKSLSSSKKSKNNYFSFRLKEVCASHLKKAGFTILNFNNNHSYDLKEKGIENTRKVLKEHNIHCLIDSLHFSNVIFLSFYLHSKEKCLEWNDSIQINNQKITIISIHGGEEGSTQVRDTCEKFLNEYRGNLYRFSHKAIDAGADLILCHGPHVPRDIEIYKNRLIAHSLGNFCTPFGFRLKDKFGEAMILKVILEDNGELKNYKTIKFRQIRNIGYEHQD